MVTQKCPAEMYEGNILLDHSDCCYAIHTYVGTNIHTHTYAHMSDWQTRIEIQVFSPRIEYKYNQNSPCPFIRPTASHGLTGWTLKHTGWISGKIETKCISYSFFPSGSCVRFSVSVVSTVVVLLLRGSDAATRTTRRFTAIKWLTWVIAFGSSLDSGTTATLSLMDLGFGGSGRWEKSNVHSGRCDSGRRMH